MDWPLKDRIAVGEELERIGCCNLCVLRYLGYKLPRVYRVVGGETHEDLEKVIRSNVSNTNENGTKDPGTGNIEVSEDKAHKIGNARGNGNSTVSDGEEGPTAKSMKKAICVACLGLLEKGLRDDWVEKICCAIKDNGIESISYSPTMSLPICILLRAYSIWFHLKNKFPNLYEDLEHQKPEVIALKSVWKWITCDELRVRINPLSDWSMDGSLIVHIKTDYEDDRLECSELSKYLEASLNQEVKSKRRPVKITRGTVESTLKNMSPTDFVKAFQSPPSPPPCFIAFDCVECTHETVFVAGRYCKYSRNLSQTPWVLNGTRKTESSVEELITDHVLPFFGVTNSKFSASGREDVDVRTLGRGRPFVIELTNPRRAIFSNEKIGLLQERINDGTDLISVRDLQIVPKKELSNLKKGEETKNKSYNALCNIPGQTISEQILDKINNQSVPFTLKQKTPIRVLHRRSVATRDKVIYEMTASPVPGSNDLFKLRVKTQAGTYVKEFVHGDFGRTSPNISEIVGLPADILALDVEEIDLDWPKTIER